MSLPKESTKLISLMGLIFLCQVMSCTDANQINSKIIWNPNINDDTYRNPVIFADYSDPDIVRVGDDFYMTASSFNCVPGLPILHSKDLVNWILIGHAIQHFADERFNIPQHGN